MITHDPNCSGCPHCNPEFRWASRDEYWRWLDARSSPASRDRPSGPHTRASAGPEARRCNDFNDRFRRKAGLPPSTSVPSPVGPAPPDRRTPDQKTTVPSPPTECPCDARREFVKTTFERNNPVKGEAA